MELLRRAILSLIFLDNFAMRSIKRVFPRNWRLAGKCNKCGKCCKEICLSISPLLLKAKYPLKLIIAWVSWLFDFTFKGVDLNNNYLVFECRHLGPEGLCNNYFWRSNVCRNYPILDYFDEPVLYPWCGYKVDKAK